MRIPSSASIPSILVASLAISSSTPTLAAPTGDVGDNEGSLTASSSVQSLRSRRASLTLPSEEEDLERRDGGGVIGGLPLGVGDLLNSILKPVVCSDPLRPILGPLVDIAVGGCSKTASGASVQSVEDERVQAAAAEFADALVAQNPSLNNPSSLAVPSATSTPSSPAMSPSAPPNSPNVPAPEEQPTARTVARRALEARVRAVQAPPPPVSPPVSPPNPARVPDQAPKAPVQPPAVPQAPVQPPQPPVQPPKPPVAKPAPVNDAPVPSPVKEFARRGIAAQVRDIHDEDDDASASGVQPPAPLAAAPAPPAGAPSPPVGAPSSPAGAPSPPAGAPHPPAQAPTTPNAAPSPPVQPPVQPPLHPGRRSPEGEPATDDEGYDEDCDEDDDTTPLV